MSKEQPTESTLGSLYRTRIGEPRTDDEVRGYWLFVLGLLLGVAGVLLFLVSDPMGSLRQISVVAGGVGLILLLVGPVIRLPLDSRATTLVAVGATIAAIGVAYFVAVFPDGWTLRNGNAPVIAIYGLGLLVIGAGGVLFPLLGSTEQETEAAALRREFAELDDVLEDAAADEADVAARVADLRHALAESSDTEAALGDAVAALSDELADAEADEVDLAARLQSLRQSQARFERYEDRGGEHRFRLRHRNGNIVATSGEGYAEKSEAEDAVDRFKLNAPGADVEEVDADVDEKDEA